MYSRCSIRRFDEKITGLTKNKSIKSRAGIICEVEMYTEKHVIPLLLKACPGWNEVLNKARTNRGDEKPGLAMYIEITVLAQYIVDSYKTGATGEFPKLFKTLEIIIQEGNEKAKELVMVGLIEDIQSISAKEPFDGRIFKQWLGEESLVAWNYVEKLWEKEDINKNE